VLSCSFRRFLSDNQIEGRLRPTRRGLALGLPLWERRGRAPAVGVFVRTSRAADDPVLERVLRDLGRVVGRPAAVLVEESFSELLQSSMTIPWSTTWLDEPPEWVALSGRSPADVWLAVVDDLGGLDLSAGRPGKPVFAVVMDADVEVSRADLTGSSLTAEFLAWTDGTETSRVRRTGRD
jgi:hypothetical protein